MHLERNWITNPLWVTTFLFRQLAVFIEHFALKCTHPVVIKWWISLEFQPVALYAINKYSFSYYPSSGISSSIMVEITAVKAVYALLFSSTWFGRYLWNYWSVEVAAAGGSWALASFYFCVSKIPSPVPLLPERPCFVFSSKIHINHSIGLNCPVKIKMIPNHSRITQGLFSVQYVREKQRQTLGKEKITIDERGKNLSGTEVIPLPVLSGKDLSIPRLVT